ncbi:ABC-F family ATP-binding cassette domain-containing protein [Spiroplasma endosymbiont of Dilophus febrilis]|uniref:ABC-F family ATP-binding cassette domain-containing protein n=1 Tax=Spiroplasma endosymbiont of Dilophus febrilis TaxID=3066292 RepID=UPI00313B522E
MSILFIKELNHSTGSKSLYQKATMKINVGEHIALIGPNGSGKTTLLNIISGKVSADKIDLIFFPYVKMGYLDQHQLVDNNISALDYLKTAYKDLFLKEQMINELYHQLSLNYEEKILNKALKLQTELDNSDFYNVEKEINNLVIGLAIDKSSLAQKLSSLSGGQKSKILLAKLLLSKNDFLLLDEPTNFLDTQQVNWLASFLQTYPYAFLLISHDQAFVNKVAHIIYAIENFNLVRYVGNFDHYLELKQLNQRQYLMEYQGQQKKIDKLQTYVNKNIARKSTAKSAQSRKKQLEKMEIIAKPQKISKPNFNFKYRRSLTSVTLKVKDLTIGYTKPLINSLSFTIKEGEKWLVQGYNGIGKTTLLETLTGNIKPISGIITIGDNVTIGYFKQFYNFPELSPIQYLKSLNPEIDDGEIRKILASFGIKRELAMQTLNKLSGGEQTKVLLAVLSLIPCSLLILDEPTNHLDDLAKDSLLEAITNYSGTVLLTSHDINFNTSWVDKTLNFIDFMIKNDKIK